MKRKKVIAELEAFVASSAITRTIATDRDARAIAQGECNAYARALLLLQKKDALPHQSDYTAVANQPGVVYVNKAPHVQHYYRDERGIRAYDIHWDGLGVVRYPVPPAVVCPDSPEVPMDFTVPDSAVALRPFTTVPNPRLAIASTALKWKKRTDDPQFPDMQTVAENKYITARGIWEECYPDEDLDEYMGTLDEEVSIQIPPVDPKLVISGNFTDPPEYGHFDRRGYNAPPSGRVEKPHSPPPPKRPVCDPLSPLPPPERRH